jgi:hypothetical protein
MQLPTLDLDSLLPCRSTDTFDLEVLKVRTDYQNYWRAQGGDLAWLRAVTSL